MRKEFNQIVDILMLPSSGDVRISLLEGFIPKNKVFTALTVITLKSGFCNNRFINAKKRWVITDSLDDGYKALQQCISVLRNFSGYHKISKKAYTILAYIISPSIIGFNKRKIKRLLKDDLEVLSIEEAVSYLGLSLKDVLIDVEETLQQCPICIRRMKVLNNNGICKSCDSVLSEFKKFRQIPFNVPINYANFPKLENNSRSRDMYIGEDAIYSYFIKDKNVLITYNKSDKKFQSTLPFYEYQNKIVY